MHSQINCETNEYVFQKDGKVQLIWSWKCREGIFLQFFDQPPTKDLGLAFGDFENAVFSCFFSREDTN